MTQTRQLDIRKRFSLADLGEGWDQCYVDYSPATISDLKELAGLKGADDAQSADIVLQFVRDHFRGGKALYSAEAAGSSSVQEMSLDDLALLPTATTNKLLELITGAQFADPKASRQEVPATPQPPSSEKPTETSSSTT